jgi:hypothetical protein
MLDEMIVVDEAHHGDCIGSDATFHKMCDDLGIPIVVHPPINPGLRAYCERGNIIRTESALPYLDRDRTIVNVVNMLIATPKSIHDRGGTWYTINYALREGVATYVVLPNGLITSHK